jgi:4-amino-4-deoxy-L-arabinose transferase-like glycosyltransferase
MHATGSTWSLALEKARSSVSRVCGGIGGRLLRHERVFLGILLVAGVAVRLLYLTIFVGLNAEPVNDGVGYDHLATALLGGQGYVSDWGEPTAFRPPVYPLFLAGIYAVTDHSLAAVRVVQAVLDTLTAIVVYLIAKELTHGSRRVASLAALGTAFYPLLIYETGLLIPEGLSYLLQFLAVWCLVLMLRDDRLYLPLAAGALMGLTVLARPTSTLWVPLILVWMILPGVLPKPVAKLAAMAVGLALVFGPWTVHNYVTLGDLVPVSTGGQLGLWTGNNPLAEGGGVEPGPETWPNADYPTRGWHGWQGLTEIESGRRFAAEGWAWIRANPDKFVLLLPKKLIRLWSPVSYSTQFGRQVPALMIVLVVPPYLVFLALAGYGAWSTRHRWREFFPLLAIAVSVNLLAVIYFGATRYAIPMMICFVILAAIGIDRWLSYSSPIVH